MKELELVERKYTTSKAREQIIEFINSFDFSEFDDIPYVKSKSFSVFFDATNNNNNMHDTAYFAITEMGFRIVSYDTEIGDYRETVKKWKHASDVFDSTCRYVDFKGLVSSIEDFIGKINNSVNNKYAEIFEFLKL